MVGATGLPPIREDAIRAKALDDAQRGAADPPDDPDERSVYFDAYVTVTRMPGGCCQ